MSEQRPEETSYLTSGVRMIARPLDPSGVFAVCTPHELRCVHRRGEMMAIRAGVVVQVMSRLRWVYVVAEGILTVVTQDQAFVFGPGTAVGARSALTGDMPVAAVTALTDACVFVIDRREMVCALRRVPNLTFGIARQLADDPGAP